MEGEEEAAAAKGGVLGRLQGPLCHSWTGPSSPWLWHQGSELSAEMDDSKVVGGKVKKPGKRGRKPAKIDLKAKLERSRQSARECRARKKLRYQYLEELVSSRERAICALREELEMYKQWCMAMDQGKIPSEIKALLTGEEQSKSQQNSSRHTKAGKTDANSNSWWRLFKMTSHW